ncbi:unnamed protein product [Sympodiomycopsis kandeliae]
MKRPYPYSGNPPNNGAQYQPTAPAPAPTQQPAAQPVDYSNYGYGGAQAQAQAQPQLTPDEQQAQWHKQWQQYYAQQAAAAAAAQSGPQQQQQAAPAAAHGGAAPPAPYGHYPAQQGANPAAGPHYPQQPYAAPHQQQQPYYQQQQPGYPTPAPQQHQSPRPPPGQQPSYYSNGPPAAKRQRFNAGPGMDPNQPYGPQPPVQPQWNQAPQPAAPAGHQAGSYGWPGSNGPPPAAMQPPSGMPRGMGSPAHSAPHQQPMAPAYASRGGPPGMSGPNRGGARGGRGGGPSGPGGGPFGQPGHTQGNAAPMNPQASRGPSMSGGRGGPTSASGPMGRGGISRGGGRGGAPSIPGGGQSRLPSGPSPSVQRGGKQGGPSPRHSNQNSPSGPSARPGGGNSNRGGRVASNAPSQSVAGGSRAGFSSQNAMPVGGHAGAKNRFEQARQNGLPTAPSNLPAKVAAARASTLSSNFSSGLRSSPSLPSSPKAPSAKSVAAAASLSVAAINRNAATLADHSMPASSKKTFTDFKINAVEIPAIGWKWSLAEEVAQQEAEEQRQQEERADMEAEKQLEREDQDADGPDGETDQQSNAGEDGGDDTPAFFPVRADDQEDADEEEDRTSETAQNEDDGEEIEVEERDEQTKLDAEDDQNESDDELAEDDTDAESVASSEQEVKDSVNLADAAMKSTAKSQDEQSRPESTQPDAEDGDGDKDAAKDDVEIAKSGEEPAEPSSDGAPKSDDSNKIFAVPVIPKGPAADRNVVGGSVDGQRSSKRKKGGPKGGYAVTGQDLCRLRICFAAATAAPPPDAPTGPSADRARAKGSKKAKKTGETVATDADVQKQQEGPSESSEGVQSSVQAADQAKESKDPSVATSVNGQDSSESENQPVPETSQSDPSENSESHNVKKESDVLMAEASVEVHKDGAKSASPDPTAVAQDAPPANVEATQSTATPASGQAADASVGDVKETSASQKEDGDKDPSSTKPSEEQEPGDPQEDAWVPFSKANPVGAPNRISISFSAENRRLSLDADVVKSVRVFRAERKIEIVVDVVRPATEAYVRAAKTLSFSPFREYYVAKGLLLETRSPGTNHFNLVPRCDLEYAWKKQTNNPIESADDGQKEGDDRPNGDARDSGPRAHGAKLFKRIPPPLGSYKSLPPLFRLARGGPAASLLESQGDTSSTSEWIEHVKAELDGGDYSHDEDDYTARDVEEMVITVSVDVVSPFVEGKWLKTGDVEDWLHTLPGFTQRPQDQAWRGKIHVVDPDPPPTIQDVFDDWSVKSFVGTGKDRRRFIQTRLQTAQDQIEILCRLVRGERASSVAMRDVGVPLAEASRKTSFASHQTHLSLAVMALFGVAEEYAGTVGALSSPDDEDEKNIKVEEEKQNESLASVTSSKEPKKSNAPSPFETKISDILMSMPTNLLFKALDGLWKETMEKPQRSVVPSRPRGNIGQKTSNSAEGSSSKRKSHHHQSHSQQKSASGGGNGGGNKRAKRDRSRSQSVARSAQGGE